MFTSGVLLISGLATLGADGRKVHSVLTALDPPEWLPAEVQVGTDDFQLPCFRPELRPEVERCLKVTSASTPVVADVVVVVAGR